MSKETLRMQIALLDLDSETPERKVRRVPYRQLDEDYRKHMSEIMTERWKDPEFREKMLSRIRDIKHKGHKHTEITRERMRQAWTPERREAHSERMKQVYRDNPQLSQIKSEKMKNVIHRKWTKEEREQMSVTRKDYIWICNDETGHVCKLHKSLPIPEGYRRGRKSMSVFWQKFREQKENFI